MKTKEAQGTAGAHGALSIRRVALISAIAMAAGLACLGLFEILGARGLRLFSSGWKDNAFYVGVLLFIAALASLSRSGETGKGMAFFSRAVAEQAEEFRRKYAAGRGALALFLILFLVGLAFVCASLV